MEAEGKVSIGTLASEAESNDAEIGLGRWRQVLGTDLLPRYYEGSRRGLIFSGATAATGVSHGTAIGTTSPFTLYNPIGSGKVLIPVKASMSYISGTLGAGTVWYVGNVNPTAAAVSGTAITVTKNYLSSPTAGNVGLAFTTATLPATPTILRPAWSVGPLLATTAVAAYVVEAEIAGEFTIAPGCALSLESTCGAAGSTPLVAFGMSWMEMDA